MGPLMDVTAGALFPSLSESGGRVTGLRMPKDEPVWVLLDKSNMSGLAKQLEFLLQGIGANRRGLDPSVTIDESNGPVHIVDGAVVLWLVMPQKSSIVFFFLGQKRLTSIT